MESILFSFFQSMRKNISMDVRSQKCATSSSLGNSVDMNCTLLLKLLENPKGCVQILGQKMGH